MTTVLELIQQARTEVAREVFEEMARHESCDKWGNPTISIGYRDSHQGKIYDDWFLSLKDKYNKQSIGR